MFVIVRIPLFRVTCNEWEFIFAFFYRFWEFNGFSLEIKRPYCTLVIHESVHWNVLQLLTLNYAPEWNDLNSLELNSFSVNEFQLPSFTWQWEWMVDGSEVRSLNRCNVHLIAYNESFCGSEAHSILKIGVESFDNKRILSFEIVHYYCNA